MPPARGRGSFGTKFSFDLGALGFGGRLGLLQLTSAQAPPSAFPSLDARPAKLINDDEHEYLVELSRNFHSLVNDSPFYLRPLKTPKPFIERYSDMAAADAEKAEAKAAKLANNGKAPSWPPQDQWPIDWERFPLELRPNSMKNISTPGALSKSQTVTPATATKRPKTTKQKNDSDDEAEIGSPKKKKRLRVKEEEVDEEAIQKRLEALEKLEQGGADAPVIKQEMVDIPEDDNAAEDGDEDDGGGKKKKASSDDEGEAEASGDEEAANEGDWDEEVGDYGEDYFDNGEGYEDEDDGDGEGPVY